LARTNALSRLSASLIRPYLARMIAANTDEHYMRAALREAQQAFERAEVPVGAVVVWGDKIIGRGQNQVERLSDSTAHAEMIALTAAFNAIGAKYLPEATLYVTVEPCLMCSGAMYWSKIGRIVYGADDIKNGYRKFTGHNAPFHPKAELVSGVLREECAVLMRDFFAMRR
jgi:tRNA(adenine34) deaminase